MRSRRFVAFAVAALAPLAASPALAEPLAPALVRLLHAPGRAHPLADASGRVPITVALPPGADAGALGLLPVAPGVGAIRLAPGDVGAFSAAHPGLPLTVAPLRRPLLDVSGAWIKLDQFRTATSFTGKGVAVGLVDTGLDVRHPDFRDDHGNTRVAWMLVGGAVPRGLHPELEKRFGCTDPKQSSCAIYAAADIDALLAKGSDEIHDLEGHGTHVASIAAGNGGPMLERAPRFVGVAPEATLIIAAPGGTEGFADADILNGTRFVFDRADALALPVVANLSLGGDYGSHDGTSTLERGLEAFVGDRTPGHVIVVSGGNSGTLQYFDDGSGPFGAHTEVHVSPDEVTRVPLVAGAAKAGHGFIWVTFRPGDDVSVAFEGPGGASWVGFTGKGGHGSYGKGSGDDAVSAGVVNNLPSGAESLTADTNSAVVVFSGPWGHLDEFTVLLRGSGDAQLWAVSQGDVEDPGLVFERAVRQGTVSVPASAPNLLAVGCTLNRIKWTPYDGNSLTLGALGPPDSMGDDTPLMVDSACYFSAAGPTPFGVEKPEISAPGGFVAAAMSVDADPRQHPGGLFDHCLPGRTDKCFVLDDRHAVAAGTSMSAPHVSGAVALLMQSDPTLTQARVTEVLQAGVRRVGGREPDPNQLGPGALDLMGALAALQDLSTGSGEPALTRSWYTLSSAYARPDPTWPVWGTIELRRIDGSLAGGIDGSKLTLSVTGGALYQPLVKVRQGMWRFAVAGRAGEAGGTLTVDVAYAGASLGARSLPIGDDAWTANDRSLDAVGGACACEAAGRSAGDRAAALCGLAALGLAVRRRRRQNWPDR